MVQISEISLALQSGDVVSAEHMAREGLQSQPEDADMLLLLATSLRAQGRYAEAVEDFRRLTWMQPERVYHWGNYATTLRALGKLQEAGDAYRRALELEPRNAAQLFNYGSLQLQQGDVHGARETLLRAHVLEPASPLIRLVAARALCECRDYRAPDLIAPWREWLPLPDDLQYELADLMQLTHWAQEAVGVLEDLLTRSPAHVRARLLLAALYERTNRLDEAAALLDDLAVNEAGVGAMERGEVEHQRAALLIRRKAFAQARDLLENTGPRHAADATHYFQLGRTCDKLDAADAAMQAFGAAHRLQIDLLRRAAPQRFEPEAPLLPAAEHSVSADDYARWPALRAPDINQAPVFIVGFPRSGTTLLEQMLDAHPKLQSMDERPFFYMLSDQLADQGFHVPQDLGKLDQSDCDELRKGYLLMACAKIERSWGAQLVDKNPLNLLWLPLIHRLYPAAKFILALRHPCDVLLSNYMQEYRSAVLAVMSATLEQLAHGYVMALEHWLHHVEIFRPSILTIRYEDLVDNPEAETQRIARFLELDDASPLLRFDTRAREKAFIGTPSYTQVIEPINRRGVGRWLRYRKYFDDVLPILEPMLPKLGYAVE